MKKTKDIDRVMGCLFGGAVGDALGYPVEFLDESSIFAQYGPQGITAHRLRDGLARVSDDTQMTLFTANGLLYATTRGKTKGIMGPYRDYIACAYREWYLTQNGPRRDKKEQQTCWLMNVPQLYAFRAPGNTCMSAIRAGCCGTVEDPVNHSKGCGGVMRVAPIGLYFEDTASGMDALRAAQLGGEAAALTHGHPLGYMPAALLTHMIHTLSHGEHACIRAAAENGLRALQALYPGEPCLDPFAQLIRQAVSLAQGDTDDLKAIHQLGEGWCGDEALAIALYCCLKYEYDFRRAVVTAVNHRGDSDSTGAIAGNIMGAWLGYSAIPEDLLQGLELADVLWELGEDLYWDCPIDEYSPLDTRVKQAWNRKYILADYCPDGRK